MQQRPPHGSERVGNAVVEGELHTVCDSQTSAERRPVADAHVDEYALDAEVRCVRC